MKRVLFLLTLSFSLICANAQITHLHTFIGEGYNLIFIDSQTNESKIYQDNSNYFGSAYYRTQLNSDNNTYTITIYDTDFTVLQVKVFNIVPIEGYKVQTVTVSKHLFDDNANTNELLVTYYDTTYSRSEYAKCLLYKEDGTIIYDFGTGRYIYMYPYLHIYNNEYRIWLQRDIIDVDGTSQTQFEVYKVNKQNPSGLQQVPAHLPNAYPNPASSTITIPLEQTNGNLNIYDTNGRLIQSFPTSNENETLNVSAYPSGQYIYEHHGKTNRFIVQ